MADFFGELGKKLSDTAIDISKKAEETFEVQKISKGEVDDTEYIALCEQIEKREEEIESQEEQIVKIKEEI